ncbi:kinesin-like protein, partial [Achlya hypogyna]
RVKKSLVRGSHVNELKAINLSLSALGNCISALSKQQSHVPYRDSKLTRLLQNSLGGNAKTALILAVTPEMSEASESLATLQFGQRAMQIQVKAHVNVVPDYKRLVEMLQAKVDSYEDKLNGMDIELQASRDAQALLLNQVGEAQLEAAKVTFDMEALKTTMQLQLAMAQTTPSSPHSEAPPDAAPSTATDMFEQFEAKLTELTAQHRSELGAMKQRFDFQVETHKQIANRANQEWHNIEAELSSERTAHLETCKELREAKQKYFQLESDHVDRVGDVCQEKKELELQLQAQLKTIQRLETANGQLQLQLQTAQNGRAELSQSIDANFVSREQVNEMETLYADAIAKLQQRVESLEVLQPKRAPPADVPRQPPPLVKKDSLIGKKAVPKIGRVMPGGRR